MTIRRFLSSLFALLLMINIGLGVGWGQGFIQVPPAHWDVVGAGALVTRPVTCTANQQVFICNGAGCGTNGEYHFCTALNTWTVGGSASAAGWTYNSGTNTITAVAGSTVEIGTTVPDANAKLNLGDGVSTFRVIMDGVNAMSLISGEKTNSIGAGAGNSWIFGGDPTHPNTIGAGAYLSAILYGYENSIAAASFSSEASGQHNRVTAGTHVLVHGGSTLTGSADYASAVGGLSNVASGLYSGVFGGRSNAASGLDSVALQRSNTASGERSAALGFSSTASALHSVAWGNAASATAVGAWMLTDSLGSLSNPITNSFGLDFAGGQYYVGGGPIMNNVKQLLAGTYTNGGTVAGSVGQTCTLSGWNHGIAAVATVALTGADTIAGGTALTITQGGYGFTAAATTATFTNGTATCSGTATIATTVGYFGLPSNADMIFSGTTTGTKWTSLWTDLNGLALFGVRNDGALAGLGATPIVGALSVAGNINITSATGYLGVNRGDGNFHSISQDGSQNMVFHSTGSATDMLFQTANSGKVFTMDHLGAFSAPGTIDAVGGFKVGAVVGVTVSTCTHFTLGICDAGT